MDNLGQEESPIIRRPSQMRTNRQLVVIGGIMGIVPTALLYVLARMTAPIDDYDFGAIYRLGATSLIIHGLLFTAFAVFQWSRLRRFADVCAWAGTTGVMAVIYFPVMVLVDGSSLVHGEKEVLITLGFAIASGLAHTILAGGVWYAMRAWARARGRRVVVQNATYCPSCMNDLSGRQSMVCSHCGTAFTLEELVVARMV